MLYKKMLMVLSSLLARNICKLLLEAILDTGTLQSFCLSCSPGQKRIQESLCQRDHATLNITVRPSHEDSLVCRKTWIPVPAPRTVFTCYTIYI